MTHSYLRTPWRHVVAGAMLGLSLLLAAGPGLAGEPRRQRLSVQIDFVRQAGVEHAGEAGRTRLAQQLSLGAVLVTDGNPSPSNPLDPDDTRRQLERAQQTQRKVQSALDRQGRSAAPAVPSAAEAQAMQARAQQMQARCGADRDCLMREAMALGAVQAGGGDAGVQSRLQGYGAAVQACERQKPAGASRDTCIAQARRQAGGAADDTDRDDDVETPYLHFTGPAACGFDVSLTIDERTEGSFGDVQGQVPFTQTTQAAVRQRRDDAMCPMLQAVLDTRSGRLWTRVVPAVREVQGVTVRSERGRQPQRQEGAVALRWHEADGWLQQRLLNLNARGEDRTRITAGARGGGQVEVTMRWVFEPVR